MPSLDPVVDLENESGEAYGAKIELLTELLSRLFAVLRRMPNALGSPRSHIEKF